MKFIYLFTLVVGLLVIKGNAQVNNDEVLFTVDGEKVLVSDFMRVYNKNLDLIKDESKNDIDEYLTLFTNFKLKLKEAESLKLDENPTYIKEFDSYKSQLAKGYLTDSKVTEELIKEAYENVSYDVKANHILIKIPETASPEDTLDAYNKILKFRERTLSEGFDKVRKEVHNGKTIYGEELGYFSGFKMVYSFEKVAFNTPVGEISQPFRTRFGYHILNVQDKRKSLGERTVAHIMIGLKSSNGLNEKPENRIQDIYTKLSQGEAFEALAKQFSDDKSSAEKGGVLSPFSKGQITSKEFEDIAFNLKDVGDVSEPFKTVYGWHIVKLLDKKPVAPFEDLREELEQKIKSGSRSKLIDEALMSKLKKQYNIENKISDLNYFISILSDDYSKNTWKLPVDFDGDKPFLKIEQKIFSYKDFGDYLLNTQRKVRNYVSLKDLISKKYDAFLNIKLIEYKEDNLENENEEYANILKEYREGLLLFDIMLNNIWNTSEKDSIGIQEYYNANKSKYLNPKRINAVIASSAKQKTLKKISKLLNKGMALDEIKDLVNTKDDVRVIFTSDTMSKDYQALPKALEFTKGISKIHKHNDHYVIVDVKEVFPVSQKSFDDARAEVVSDYQANKENEWLSTLISKYEVVLNEDVFAKVKSQIKSQ